MSSMGVDAQAGNFMGEQDPENGCFGQSRHKEMLRFVSKKLPEATDLHSFKI